MNKTRKITINVLQEDIDKGLPFKAKYCPVALALKRETKEDVEVSRGLISIFPSGRRSWKNVFIKQLVWYVDPPQDITKFIIDFDLGLKVEPFKAEVEFKSWT